VGRIGAAAPQPDSSLPLIAIAAILLGGTTLAGGSGSVVGTALGVLFIGFLQNGLSISGVPTVWQQVLTGAILVIAVLGDRLGLIRLRRKAPPREGLSGATTSEGDPRASGAEAAKEVATKGSK
jgi:ribose transport system permease protein